MNNVVVCLGLVDSCFGCIGHSVCYYPLMLLWKTEMLDGIIKDNWVYFNDSGVDSMGNQSCWCCPNTKTSVITVNYYILNREEILTYIINALALSSDTFLGLSTSLTASSITKIP